VLARVISLADIPPPLGICIRADRQGFAASINASAKPAPMKSTSVRSAGAKHGAVHCAQFSRNSCAGRIFIVVTPRSISYRHMWR